MRPEGDIVAAFNRARSLASSLPYGDPRIADAVDRAFTLAKECWWDYEEDEDFYLWALKATEEEICSEGLRRALQRIEAGGQ